MCGRARARTCVRVRAHTPAHVCARTPTRRAPAPPGPWLGAAVELASTAFALSEMVTVELRTLEGINPEDLAVDPGTLPTEHAAAPLPLFSEIYSISGQAFVVTASQTGPRELTLLSYHAITDTWATAGAVTLPGAPLSASARPRLR